MKKFWWVARLTLAATFVAAMAGSSGVASAQPTTTITFWHGYSDAELAALQERVIPAFEATHPTIKVKAQAIPYDDLRKKLLAGVAGGETPDVLRSDIAWVPEFADMGALVPLSDAMPDFSAYSAQVFPGPLQTTYWSGKYYGLPLDTNTRVLIYNKTLYSQAGIDSPPATVAQFESDMNQLKSLGPDVYGFADGGTYAWAIMPWIWSYGGDITDPSMSTSTGYINGPAAVTAVTKWKQWLDSGLLSPNLLGGGIGTSDGLGKNLYANILDGPWMTPILGKQYPELQYQYALMPAGPAGSISVIGGEDLTVFQASQHQAEAIEFARFMLSPDAQLEMGKAGQVPVLSNLTGDPSLPPYFSVFMQQLQTARARLPHPRWAKMDSAITDAVQAALRGTDIQTALDGAADQINTLLAG